MVVCVFFLPRHKINFLCLQIPFCAVRAVDSYLGMGEWTKFLPAGLSGSNARLGCGRPRSPLCHGNFLSDLGTVTQSANLPHRVIVGIKCRKGEWQAALGSHWGKQWGTNGFLSSVLQGRGREFGNDRKVLASNTPEYQLHIASRLTWGLGIFVPFFLPSRSVCSGSLMYTLVYT